MQLLLIRHAIAMEREDFASSGQPDSERPLTPEGQRRMVAAVAGLRRQVESISLLATSPYVRARQTADIVAEAYPAARRAETATLVPDEPLSSFEKWAVANVKGEASREMIVAAVGHEPHIGSLAAWLITGVGDGGIEFKKGGAALIEFDGVPRRGEGILRWLLTPGQLRRLS